MRTRRKSGFTLIELLVVIAIIAILAAILFPVFARAREAARKSTCQSNMKECAIAIQLYWTDYDATLPSSALCNGSIAPNARFLTKAGRLPRSKNTTDPEYALGATWVQVVYSKMQNPDIMYCPSDPVERTPADPVANQPVASYWWKYAADRAWLDVNTKCTKEGNFAFTSDQIILYEHNGWHFGDQGGLKNGIQINVAYLDTHVKTHSLVNSSASYTQDCAFAGEPAYYNFDQRAPKGSTVTDYDGDGKLTDTIAGNPPPADNPPAVTDDAAKGYWHPNFYSDMLR